MFKKYDNLRPALLERMPPMETARPQANGIIGLVNGEPETEEDRTPVSDTQEIATQSDSVSPSVNERKERGIFWCKNIF